MSENIFCFDQVSATDYTSWVKIFFGVLTKVILIVIIFSVYNAEGRIFTVTSTNDSVDNPPIKATKFASLRDAIIAANRAGGNNTILLSSNAYILSISGSDETNSFTGDLDITRGNLTIVGSTSTMTIIDATGLGDRVFQIFPLAQLTLENLTVKGGTAPGNFYGIWGNGESGGGIFNAGTLLLEHCIITNNSSGGGNILEGNGGGTDGGDGGGIYNSGFLMVENCTVTGNSPGAGADGASGGNGGGIKNDGRCLLTDSILSQNQSGAGGGADGNAGGFGGSAGNGAGIFNSGTGTMILNKCVVGANVGVQGSGGGDPGIATFGSPGGSGGNGGSGAGIYNAGKMQINFSSVCANISGDGGGGGSFGAGGNAGTGGNGAGIFNAGKLSLNTSTISDNLCGSGGSGGDGGFYGGAVGGSGGSGGGIYNSGLLDLISCTIALNRSGKGGNGGNSDSGFNDNPAASGGQGGGGGGILNVSDTTVLVRNSLIALNSPNVGGAGGTSTSYSYSFTPPNEIDIETTVSVGSAGASGLGFDIYGDFTSQKFNLIGIADDSIGFTNGVNADHVGSFAKPIDPLLGSLQMNGGFTPTHALLPGSPAIDRGNSFGVCADQRGYRRPYNFSSIPNARGGDGSDIGAFELQP